MRSSEPLRILLVEDDDVDIQAVRRGLEKWCANGRVHVAHDGVEALEVLRGQCGAPPLQRPFIVLLDLNLPRMGGLEFLAELRADDALRDIVVFVLTTSDDPQDKARAFHFNTAGYFLKGDPSDRLAQTFTLLDNYWRISELPR